MADMHSRRRASTFTHRRTLFSAACAFALSQPAFAVDVDTGIADLYFRWDNTVKYSAGLRVKDRSPALLNGPNPASFPGDGVNADDGDRNFGKGLISNRIDLLSEADLTYRDFGARISGAAWYDSVYNRTNSNNSAGVQGPGTNTANVVGSYNEFSSGTRKLHGRDAEVLDAFVSGHFDVGDSRATIRLGQHALSWGESLFFGSNAIAGAMNPSDIIKASTVPNSQVKEILLPVPQISGQLQLNPTVSIGAYYQFKFRENRFPAVGSYFSTGDSSPEGQAFAIGPPDASGRPTFIPSTDENKAKNSGQGGIQLRFSALESDFGLYAIRFHDKSFQQIPVLSAVPNPGFNPTDPRSGPPQVPGSPSRFMLEWQENITAYGASFSHTFGVLNLAGEASIRRTMDLPSPGAADLSAVYGTRATNNSDNPAYAVGRTAHANLSEIWQVPRSPLWAEASLIAEVAWNRLLSCTKNCSTLPTNGTRDAWQLQAVFTPSYKQVLSQLNLSIPIGVTYTPAGSRSLALGPGSSGPENGGTFNVGLQGDYQDVWRFGLTYTAYYGKANTFTYSTVDPATGATLNNFSYAQTLKDRNYVSLSLNRTF